MRRHLAFTYIAGSLFLEDFFPSILGLVKEAKSCDLPDDTTLTMILYSWR